MACQRLSNQLHTPVCLVGVVWRIAAITRFAKVAHGVCRRHRQSICQTRLDNATLLTGE